MAKQTFTTGQVLTAAQMTSLQQTAMGGGSTTAKTTSYVLVAADAGTVVQMNAAGATTITVNTALFAAGDSVQIQNVGAGVCTITAGTATVSTSAVLTLKQYDAGTLYFNSTSAAIFFSSDAADSPLTTKGDLFTYSTTNARLGVGTDAQILVADSTASTGLKWAAASSGAMVLITRQSFSNVTTTTTTFDSIFSTTYGSYLVVIESMYAGTGADDLHCQFRYAGPTTQAASYFGNDLSTESGTTTTTNTAQSNTAFAVLSLYTGPSTNPGQGQFSVFNASGASAEPSIVSSYIEGGRGASDNSIVSTLAARIYTGLIFKSSSSNITGTVSVYGLVKA